MIYNFNKIEAHKRYKLMSQTIIPRPIAWIITKNNGVVNIAPFSFFNGVSSQPPVVMVSIGHKSNGAAKDTLYNLRKNKKCVICSVLPEALKKMHFSSNELDAKESEAESYNIQTKKIFDDFPPMIEGAPTAMFCTLHQEVALKGSETIPLFLKIEHQYIEDSCIKENDNIEIELLARVGKNYALLGETIIAPKS